MTSAEDNSSPSDSESDSEYSDSPALDTVEPYMFEPEDDRSPNDNDLNGM